MTYKELFKNNKIVRKLSTVQFIAYFGAWFSNVAIFSMLVDFGASPLLISIVTAMFLLPGVLIAPFSGTIVDRLDVKPLMLGLMFTEFSMTIGFMFINSLDDIWLLLILLFIRMGSASMFFTTEMTLLPKILSGETLVKANELHSIIWSFTFTAGMAIGGIVVDNFGVKTSFIIDALFFLASMMILSQIDFLIKYTKHTQSIIESIKDGISYLKNHKHIFHYMFLHASVGLTSFDALVTLLADYDYRYIISVPLAIGLTNAIRAFALMIGPLFISKYINKTSLYYIFIAQGLSIILWAFIQQNFYIALVGVFLTGFFTTTIWSYTYAMLQEVVDKNYLGRILAYNEMIFMLSNITTSLFIGIAANIISLSSITTILGIGFIFISLYYKKIFL